MSYSVILSDALREIWSNPPRFPSECSVLITYILKYLDHGVTVGFKSNHIEKNPGSGRLIRVFRIHVPELEEADRVIF